MKVFLGVVGFVGFVGALMAAAYFSSHGNAASPSTPPSASSATSQRVGAGGDVNAPLDAQQDRPQPPADSHNDEAQPLPALFVWKDDAATASAIALAGARKRPALLHLWASWCGPCRAELPSLLALQKRGDVDVIAVSVDDHYGDVRKYFKGDIPSAVVWDKNITLERALGVENIPTTFLVDKRGNVVDRFDGAQEWNAPEMKKALNDELR